MSNGKINVQTENIFPIIKKFLYSDHEIFLRELVSNAVDATQKLKALSSAGEVKGELGDLIIEVEVDKKGKKIILKDKGIGLTSSEVEKYIAQIAFSGAEEFVNRYKDKAPEASQIIGHFGLGFYSAFMVASKVEIISKSYRDEPAVHWVCEGNPDYKMEAHKRKDRGTEIILHITQDSEEFLEVARIDTLLKKYCRFLPVEIRFDGKVINNPTPAWTRKPSELNDKEYTDFYKELYPFAFEDPLFHIHLNVDYPFNLTGILYFPRLKKTIEIQKDKIQLYCNQVFVTDSVESIVPDFLTLLRGVIDSPDIPLNVSRSYLQSDASVKKISAHITKKVADKLEELFKKDRKEFEAKWEDIRLFIQYGMISDEKFYEKAQQFALFRNTDGNPFTLTEYADKIKPLQTDKEKNLIYLYSTDAVAQHSYIATAKDRGYDVLLFDSPIDPHYISHLERKFTYSRFVRVDSDTVDNLVRKEDIRPSKLNEQQQGTLKPVIEKGLPEKKFTVVFEALGENDPPMLVTQNEFMRRMNEMNRMGAGGMGEMPEMYNLVVNSNHPLVTRMLLETDSAKQHRIAKQTTDLALLSQGLLKGEELTLFIKRSVDLIGQ